MEKDRGTFMIVEDSMGRLYTLANMKGWDRRRI